MNTIETNEKFQILLSDWLEQNRKMLSFLDSQDDELSKSKINIPNFKQTVRINIVIDLLETVEEKIMSYGNTYHTEVS